MKKYEKEVQQALLDEEKRVLEELEDNYAIALHDINLRLENLLGRNDADLPHVIYQIEYQKALKTQVKAILEQLQVNEFETISEYLTRCYNTGFIGSMYSFHKQGLPFLMPIDQKQVVDAIQHKTKLKKKLYDELGVDIKKLQKDIAGEISRGISTGLGYGDIARNISLQGRIPLNRAMTIARTESHRIQCQATSDAQYKAKEKGADVLKQWDAALDGATRPNHRKLDGQIRELDEPFEVAGMKAMFPGDFGRAEEDCNCRCALLQRARWALDEEELEELKKRAEYYGLDKTKDFEDFQKKYLKASEKVRDSGQKMNDENTSQEQATEETTIESINANATESLLDAYDARRKHFNLNESTADELKNNPLNPIKADYNGVSVETAKVFDETIRELSDEYLTGLTKIEVGDKKEFFGVSTIATTEHINSVGQKTLILNPHKTGDFDKLTERIKELSDKGYAVKIEDGLEGRYIATHEFAHSLIDLSGNYKNYIGMDVKQMKGIKKEIDTLFDAYKNEVNMLESAYKKKEIAFLEGSFSTNTDMDALEKLQKAAQDAKRALDDVKISRYSMESADEFLAEAFTQNKIGLSQSKYSDKLVGILDKHFKKETLENTGENGIIKVEKQALAEKSKHASIRISQRQITDADIQDAINNPLHKGEEVIDELGRKSIKYIGKNATVCVNPDTGVITTLWKTGTKTRKKYEEGD